MSLEKSLPFAEDVWHEIAEQYDTPVYVYDEAGIRGNAQAFQQAFDWSPDARIHFAVKATPTSGILRVVEDEGMGFDCSSDTELEIMRRWTLGKNGLFYTSNNTPDEHYRQAHELGAIINVDKAPYVGQVARALGKLPARMAIRYNPGEGKVSNSIIGRKFGDTEEHVLLALRNMRGQGVEQIGLHAMVASNEREPDHFASTAKLLHKLADKAVTGFGINISFINIGGGVGIDYEPTDTPIDIAAIGEAVKSQWGALDIPVFAEPGRSITGPHGYLMARVTQGIVESEAKYLTIDTSVNNMARLATVKDSYHELTVVGREGDPTDLMSVVGSMCVDTDVMFKDRLLPVTSQPGDLFIIHDAGAHARSNATNYNGKRRAGEVLVHPDGSHQLIRRAETIEDVLVTDIGL